MSAQENKSQGTQPPPPTSSTGHPLPRRTSPANSVTLKHHRTARDASLRASAGSAPAMNTDTSRRNSSGDSNNTSQSDPKKWFDQSNQNPTATFDNNAMDVDPPFFQRETDSSSGDKSLNPLFLDVPVQRPTGAQSSSADEYRSVIDDLTVEIQRLKDELKRYKQNGPDTLRKDKLFEIKVHGLPRRKKRELEATLRDFAAGLESSPDASSKRDKSSRPVNRNRMYSNSGSMSKHASSSSGSNARPVDSAYASMSTGANSSGTSLGRPPTSMRVNNSERKVENYLRDIPEGLYPRHVLMTDKERKRIVVRRLEQLFTGKMGGRRLRNKNPNGPPPAGNTSLPPVVSDEEQPNPVVHQPPSLGNLEPTREAKILAPEQSEKKSRSRDNGSASNSNGDQTESGGNGNSSGGAMATNVSPTAPPGPEQRATRLTDLDPNRTQIPSENMDYIKHLGLVPPGLLARTEDNDVSPDAEGWVYLNLLCNLAQLHIMNVTPDFVRSSVSEMSTKFQLSPDGRKIRWRGGTEGTKFSSDSSGENSGYNSMVIDSTSMDTKHKRQKTGHSSGTTEEFQSGGSSSKYPSKFGPQFSTSEESFHYKPLFVHQDSSNGQTSADETLSSFGPVDESNMDDSRWGQSGSGASNRRKRRHDGAIIYYSGAPFCTDLSGDPGDVSPTTYLQSSNQDSNRQFGRPLTHRSESGSSLPYRPLSDSKKLFSEPVVRMEIDGTENLPGLATDSSDDESELEFDLEWSTTEQIIVSHTLEPCGLGRVVPEDHFMVIVTTKRPKEEIPSLVLPGGEPNEEEAAEHIIRRLESMSTSSPGPGAALAPRPPQRTIEIDYVSGRIRRLTPVLLPPPAIFVPPFSTDTSEEDDGGMSISFTDDESEEEVASRRANLHHSDDYPDGVDLSSGDEDGEDPENEPDTRGMYDDNEGHRPLKSSKLAERKKRGSAEGAAGQAFGRSKSSSAGASPRTGGSSAATAGGLGSDTTGDISS